MQVGSVLKHGRGWRGDWREDASVTTANRAELLLLAEE
jgi:hypothetical protein